MDHKISLDRNCRFCLMKAEIIMDVKDAECGDNSFLEVTASLFGPQHILDDGFPKQVCELCRNNMECCYAFEEMCQKSIDKIYCFLQQTPPKRASFNENGKTDGIINLKKNCLSCLSNVDDLVNAAAANGEQISLIEILQYVLGKKILMEFDCPKLICKSCEGKIQLFYTFKHRCETSFEVVSKHIKLQTDPDLRLKDFNLAIEEGTSFKHAIFECKDNEAGPIKIVEKIAKSSFKNKSYRTEEMEWRDVGEPSSSEDEDIKTHESNVSRKRKGKVKIGTGDLISSKEDICNVSNKKKTKAKSISAEEDICLEIKANVSKIMKSMVKSKTKDSFHKTEMCDTGSTSISATKKNGDNESNSEDVELPFSPYRYKGEKPFECKICGKPFARKTSVRLHEPIHSGKRPHTCEICGKDFFYKVVLKEHMLSHTNERPFQCDKCDKAFTTKSKLRTHEKIHTGLRNYKCEICNKGFLSKPALTDHQFIHSNEKRFGCSECGQRFKSGSTFRNHVKKTHNSNKVHKCLMCSRSYNTEILLKKHICAS